MSSDNLSFDPAAVSRAFKAYDVRGRIPDELSADVVRLIGNAFVQFLGEVTGPIVVGYDVRPTSEEFSQALTTGILDAGASVLNIGMVGTDMVYYATAVHKAQGGIMITASHNPADYNGLKFVKADAVPVSGETGLSTILDIVLANQYLTAPQRGTERSLDVLDPYIDHILGFVDQSKIPSLKVVMNPGNGCAGPVLEKLNQRLPQISVVPVFFDPDGSFPNGIPNPLLSDQREDTAKAVRDNNADLGVAWDGDFDRCFFYDNEGNFVEGYYLVALFGRFFARRESNAKIIHDPRLVWATIDAVKAVGGQPVEHKAGHAFIKDRMRLENAIYAGEMSAHHYFRDNFYADNGMIPMLTLFQILGEEQQSLKELVKSWMDDYPVSGEINITVSDGDKVLQTIESQYKPTAEDVSYTDGLSLSYPTWRFNLRKSNTEPVIRLNVETRGDWSLMEQKRDELIQAIQDAS